MDSTGHRYYEREASKLKLMNAAMQLALLQKKIAGDQKTLRDTDGARDAKRSTTTTVRNDQNSK